MHSEGILAGELKHGPLALIDKEMPVIMIIMRDACYSKCQNALQQVTARSVRKTKQKQQHLTNLLAWEGFHLDTGSLTEIQRRCGSDLTASLVSPPPLGPADRPLLPE